jgi:predicted O-linked N-acetylglucosamine transferase (SPINDLY family)
MLTLPGSKQISRTAAGFATALGCGEMVADSAKQFEDDAVRLGSSFRRPPPANSREEFLSGSDVRRRRRMAARPSVSWDALRARLVRARKTAPLFDMDRFVKELEGVLLALAKHGENEQQSGEVPAGLWSAQLSSLPRTDPNQAGRKKKRKKKRTRRPNKD